MLRSDRVYMCECVHVCVCACAHECVLVYRVSHNSPRHVLMVSSELLSTRIDGEVLWLPAEAPFMSSYKLSPLAELEGQTLEIHTEESLQCSQNFRKAKAESDTRIMVQC